MAETFFFNQNCDFLSLTFFIDDAHEHHFIDFSVEILERAFTLGHRIDIIHFCDLDAFFKLIMSKYVHELIVLGTIAWPSMFEQAMCAREKNWKRNYNTHIAGNVHVNEEVDEIFQSLSTIVWVCRMHVRCAIWL